MRTNLLGAIIGLLISTVATAQTPNVPGPIAITWQIAHEIGWTTQQPSIHFTNLVYAQVNVTPAYGPAPNTWTVADASAWGVPCNSDPAGPAKALLVAGIIGITPSNPATLANLTLHFRKLGDATAISPPSFAYIAQTETISDGSRTNMQTWVALDDCKFEWSYSNTVSGSWPSVPSYLINLSPMMWVR